MKTPAQIHSEDTRDREEIHGEDVSQVADLKLALQAHCAQNEAHDLIVEKNFDLLLPLADLIPTLTEIVENQKAMSYVGKKVLKIIGYLAAVISFLYLIFKFWDDVKK